MNLNTLRPANGSRRNRTRVGRGIGSGLGKTCGRGHKGQTSRAGGYHKVGFEGGQMPLQRRIPKFGFISRQSLVTVEIRLGELNKITGDHVSLETLRAANVIDHSVKRVKIFASGTIEKPLTISREIPISKGAKKAIESAGGKIEK